MHTLVIHQFCPMCDKLPRTGDEELNSVCVEPFLVLCFEKSADWLFPCPFHPKI